MPPFFLRISSAILLTSGAGALFMGTSAFVSEMSARSYHDEVEGPTTNIPSDWIVLYYSTMCGHCTTFAPTFARMATTFSSGQIRFAAINMADSGNRDQLAAKAIRSYPTIRRVHRIDQGVGVEVVLEESELPAHPVAALWETLHGLYEPIREAGVASNGRVSSGNGLRTDNLSYIEDASSALSYLLNSEVFRGATVSLGGSKLEPLTILLRLCSVSFELESVSNDCTALWDIGEQVQSGGTDLAKVSWEAHLNATANFKPIAQLAAFESCPTPTCAMWRLLHVFSLGMGGRVVDITPKDAMAGIQTTADIFMSCEECRKHFLRYFDTCELGRCEITDAQEAWKPLSLWLWRVHNDVTREIHPQRAAWPSAAECPVCLTAEGTFNDEAVARFLAAQFTLAHNPTSQFDVKHSRHTGPCIGGVSVILFVYTVVN